MTLSVSDPDHDPVSDVTRRWGLRKEEERPDVKSVVKLLLQPKSLLDRPKKTELKSKYNAYK